MSSDTPAASGRRRGTLVVAACLALLLALGAVWASGNPGGLPAVFDWQRRDYQAPGEAATLSDIQDIDQLATLFNEDEGVPRLVLLLAPT